MTGFALMNADSNSYTGPRLLQKDQNTPEQSGLTVFSGQQANAK